MTIAKNSGYPETGVLAPIPTGPSAEVLLHGVHTVSYTHLTLPTILLV